MSFISDVSISFLGVEGFCNLWTHNLLCLGHPVTTYLSPLHLRHPGQLSSIIEQQSRALIIRTTPQVGLMMHSILIPWLLLTRNQKIVYTVVNSVKWNTLPVIDNSFRIEQESRVKSLDSRLWFRYKLHILPHYHLHRFFFVQDTSLSPPL